MKKMLLVMAFLGMWYQAKAGIEKDLTLPYLGCPLALTLHYVISEPTRKQAAFGDVFFLHGLGDAAENHAPLFKFWNDAGFRVIAVDLPSHGRTTGASLNWSTFSGLSKYLAEFLNLPKIRPDAQRPLIVAGWSTGGLLAVRMVQKNAFRALGRKVDGLILYAPGISVKALPGEWGTITERTLTRNSRPEHVLPIRPTSPFLVPAFALRLKVNSWLAQLGTLPLDLPTLVFFAGSDSDRYVYTDRTKAWFETQIRNGGAVWGYQFPDAFHELDNELDEVANRVRITSELFSSAIVSGQVDYLLGEPGIRTVEVKK